MQSWVQRCIKLFVSGWLCLAGLSLAVHAQETGAPARAETSPADPDAANLAKADAAEPASPENSAGGKTRRAGDQRNGSAAPIPKDLWGALKAGGPYLIPIALCSVLALAFAFERLVVLRRRRVIPRDFVTRFLDHIEQGKLDRKSALKLCEDNGSPIAFVFAHGVRKWGKPSVEVEQAIIDGGERQVVQLRKHIRVLNLVATISPLLGLLGTVMGMITCFNEISVSKAMGSSEKLAEGIGYALVNTAAGLAVAIPALILFSFFAGRVDALVAEMDLVSQKVVDLISAEGLANNPAANAPARTVSKTKIAAPTAPAAEPKKPVMG